MVSFIVSVWKIKLALKLAWERVFRLILSPSYCALGLRGVWRMKHRLQEQKVSDSIPSMANDPSSIQFWDPQIIPLSSRSVPKFRRERWIVASFTKALWFGATIYRPIPASVGYTWHTLLAPTSGRVASSLNQINK